jgi:signal transduction histidine kinase
VSRLLRAEPRVAARQAAALFTLAGLLALVGAVNDPARLAELLVIAAADLTVAAVTTALPWRRWRPWAPAVLALPAFAVLGFSTWAFGGVVAGTGPFLVLIYAWAGLHFDRRILLGLIGPALAAYVVPLVVTRQPPDVLGTAAVLLPVAVGVALVIERQARRLREDRERIAQVERWRAALVATLAHDVRSPLTTFQMVLDELRDDDGQRADQLIAAASRQVDRMNRLASSLLDLDRIDTHGTLRLDVRPLPVRDVVCEAVALLRTGVVDVQVDPALVVEADRDRLEQIVVNLIGNSLRHGEPPVTVQVTTDGNVARLAVRDHGSGVAADSRSGLFTQFASGVADSVGLGLWIVRQLARAHGGDVHYEDARPGARMVVSWPANPSVRDLGAGRTAAATPAGS